MTNCTQCGGTELVEDERGKTIRCPECAGGSDTVDEVGTIAALQADVALLRNLMNGVADLCDDLHGHLVAGSGLDPAKYGSGYSLLRDKIRSALKGGA